MDRLKFIVPDWDDIVDPEYDFVNEKHGEKYKKSKFRHGARIWHLFSDSLPIDGVLVSRSVIEHKINLIEASGGIKKYLRLPSWLGKDKFQVIADCGAWQYKTLEKPPYEPKETLDFYERLGVDYGVSVDHIAFFGDARSRIDLTFKYAVESFELWKQRYGKGEYNFILLASVQGLEVNDYINFLRKLYDKGVRHFALGGLAPRTSEFIQELVRSIETTFKGKGIEKIHILGVARPSLIDVYRRLTEVAEEVSFDNATYLRMAWMRGRGNYITLDGKAYTAIRVRKGSEGEREVLETLRNYAYGFETLENAINVLSKYVSRNGESEYLPYYVATLRDRPWEKCPCPICKNAGIEVLIFRGNDRNRRRGFHNLFVFNSLLKQGTGSFRFTVQRVDGYDSREKFDMLANALLARGITAEIKRILVIAHCTAEKEVDIEQVRRSLAVKSLSLPSFDLEKESEYITVLKEFAKPAEEMYGGTFRAIRNLVNRLRECGKSVDLYIISARYGVISGKQVIIPYEASLKGLTKEKLTKWAERLGAKEKLEHILLNNYDLIIVVLPREYYAAVKDTLNPLLQKSNVVMIIPTSVVARKNSIKALILPGSTIPRRLRSLRMLSEALMELFQCSRNGGILKFLNYGNVDS